jgi:6-hydroxycyclohex-1-ene-1-carbonyl-CoA dehydrogenase
MARGLFLTAVNAVELREFDPPEPRPGEARVRVAGCGLCHTDMTFYSGSVSTKRPPPLVLGHEIAGVVEEAPEPYAHLVGRQVIVPAVLPCGECDLCRTGHDTACLRQVMPGNHIDGGFATEIVVPAVHLALLPEDLRGHTLAELAVVADAVTTPYQAMRRACVKPGDLVIVIGAGGIGSFAVQIARAFGAEVAAIDIDPARLDRAGDLGAKWTFGTADARAIKKSLAVETGICTGNWRILEMSGTAAGQTLAWGLLPPAGTLGVVGFTMDKPDIRLSNLMALDATAFGNWGCSPRHYPAVVDLVLSGRVRVKPLVEFHALDDAPALFASPDHRMRRPIVVP